MISKVNRRSILAVIWDDRSVTIEQETCEILGVRTLRDYLAEKKSGCKFFKDRSLAIAHGYDDDLWEEVTDNKGKTKWQPKKDAAKIAESLVRQKQI